MAQLELLSLYVKDAGPLRDVRLDFTGPDGRARPVTVLGGANGSGKTTVLHAIEEAAWRLQGKSPDREAARRLQGVEAEFLWEGRKISQASDDPALAQRISEQRQEPLDLFARPPTAADARVPSVLSFPYRRELSVVRGQEVAKAPVRYEWVYRYKQVRSFPGTLDAYLIWLDYADPAQLQAVMGFLHGLPFGGKTFYIDRKALAVLVTTPEGRVHPLAQLSSGEQNLLILLLELKRRLLPHSIVLIDEIENSLHLAFQHRLAQALLQLQRETPFQLIVTTHSRTFVEIFGASSTLVLTEF